MIGAGEVLTEYLSAYRLREVPVCGSSGNMAVTLMRFRVAVTR